MNKPVGTIVKLGVIATLIIAAATRQQYIYYTFVRWVVFATSAYFTFTTYNQKQIGLSIYFSCLAILFNPFKPFWFQKATWHLIDYFVAAIIGASLIFDWKTISKKGNSDN